MILLNLDNLSLFKGGPRSKEWRGFDTLKFGIRDIFKKNDYSKINNKSIFIFWIVILDNQINIWRLEISQSEKNYKKKLLCLKQSYSVDKKIQELKNLHIWGQHNQDEFSFHLHVLLLLLSILKTFW